MVSDNLRLMHDKENGSFDLLTQLTLTTKACTINEKHCSYLNVHNDCQDKTDGWIIANQAAAKSYLITVVR
jgi:hypothetical protein